MNVHEISEFSAYPLLHTFLAQHVSMQLGDVRDMLRLPMPDLGITHGCNFAATIVLCSLVSGASVSIYQPSRPTVARKTGEMQWIGSGAAFKGLLVDFFPWDATQSVKAPTLATEIYDYFRNPLAHALGVHEGARGRVEVLRLGALLEHQLVELEQLGTRPPWLGPTLTTAGKGLQLLVEGFYRDVLGMMQRLARDAAQMNAAEARFAAGNVIWRHGKP